MIPKSLMSLINIEIKGHHDLYSRNRTKYLGKLTAANSVPIPAFLTNDDIRILLGFSFNENGGKEVKSATQKKKYSTKHDNNS